MALSLISVYLCWLIHGKLFFQAYHGHHHAMEVLVQSLLDLDVRNSQGRTPLDLAAFKGHVECVDVLINQGASILVKDFTLKRTPIHAAGMDLMNLPTSEFYDP